MLFKPFMYQKDIFTINYQKLKEKGIRCLVFDLDNTLALISEKECPTKTKKLINSLKKDFLIVIASNNNRKRIVPYLKDLEIDGVSFCLKPTTWGLRRIKKRYHLNLFEMCMIGDQLVTDILSGNLFHITTVLVDPLGYKDLKITKLNRLIENQILKKYKTKKLLERGKYYG